MFYPSDYSPVGIFREANCCSFCKHSARLFWIHLKCWKTSSTSWIWGDVVGCDERGECEGWGSFKWYTDESLGYGLDSGPHEGIYVLAKRRYTAAESAESVDDRLPLALPLFMYSASNNSRFLFFIEDPRQRLGPHPSLVW